MTEASKTGSSLSEDPKQVFRKFAWNIAGTLVSVKAGRDTATAEKMPVKRTQRRTARKSAVSK